MPEGLRTVDDLVALHRERPLSLVTLLHVGGDGRLKTLDVVPRDADHLREVLTSGERADGSSLFPGTGITSRGSDVLLRPRPAQAFVDPFAAAPVLAVPCGHASPDGRPLPQSPDTIVRRADARLRERGLALLAHAEVEFFLGAPPDRAGAAPPEGGYHAAGPDVFGEEARRKSLTLLARLGVPVKYGHAEVGVVPAGGREGRVWEQHEIELGLAPLPEAAEAVVLARWVLARVAREEGLRISFDPVVREGHAGSGLHVHLAPVTDPHRPPGAWIVAGLVRWAGALMAFGNVGATSFLRLSQARETPAAPFWGMRDRAALVRIPAAPASGPPTAELRLPDGSAHAHLLLAGIAQAISAAHDDPQVERLAAALGDPASSAAAGIPPIPRTTDEVARALGEARPVLEAGGVFPPAVIDAALRRLAR